MEKKLEELEIEFGTNLEGGLDESQVEQNREKYGKNELEEKKKTPLILKFLGEFKDPLIIILIIAAVVSIIIDPHEWVESLIIMIVVLVNAILGLYQENKAEKSLEALQKMSAATCKVIRNNSIQTIDANQLVVGDIIYVEAGDSIPADARIIECSNLKVEEAALTGESVPVNKNSDYIEADDIPLGDRKNCLFSSTYVTNGKAKAVVTAVGMRTEIGKIAGMLSEQKDDLTPLQHKLNKVGSAIGILCLVICVIVFLMEMITLNWDWSKFADAFKIAVSLAVAAIPEGLATVVTIVLSIGVTKMSKQNAIVKKLPAVETLGSCNVICSDKTGTLTQNKMTVTKLYLNEVKDAKELTFEERKMVTYFAICCDASIETKNGNLVRIGDPTELALLDINIAYGEDIHSYARLLDLPFDSDRKLMTTVIKDGKKYIAITKGAPDRVINLSVNGEDIKKKALEANKEMAMNALRVLALGVKEFTKMPTAEDLEYDLTFVGLVGMIDPARPEVKDSIRVATAAGIKTVMITGDHIVTASAIAKELGILKDGDRAITSQELEDLSDEYLEEHIHEFSVFARVAPKDKVRIVEAWQKRDAIVAMTGDGVNDAPALKKAEIGCAMGITGTDVSKEAADMILTDDNFSTIVSAVKEGRGIYDNIRKCVKYLLSSNIGEVLTIFIASLLGVIGILTGDDATPLAAMHLLWINLITDSLPAFGIGMEEAEDSVMYQKPRPKHEGFFANGYAWKICVEGVIIGGVTLAAYLLGNLVFNNHMVGQTMAFLTLSSTQLFHAYNVKSHHSVFSPKSYKNKFMNFAFVVGFALQIAVIYIPGIQDLFEFAPLTIGQFGICIGLSLVMVVIMEIAKLVNKVKAKKAE
ncbi:MAG: calcium-translocating P-type ATPase, PMCA-type [Erysipelotrichaceae bacterium]|nr:calcium-translocating P-type ATPase, PMCA-type [Erysipelotrichaceae bacterium]